MASTTPKPKSVGEILAYFLRMESDSSYGNVLQGCMFLVPHLTDDINRTYDGDTLLHLAVRKGDHKLVLELLRRGAKPSSKGKFNRRPLQIAARDGNIQLVRLLIENKAKVRARDESGDTAMHDASTHDIIVVLLEKEAAVNARNCINSTPLHHAVLSLDLRTVDLLLDAGANANCQDWSKWTPLHIAASKAKPDLVRALVNKGRAILGVRNNNGNTPLHLAARAGCPETMEILLQKGARTDIKNDEDSGEGDTALHEAASSGNPRTVELLLEYEVPVDIENAFGRTPLGSAANPETMEVLLSAGADVNHIYCFGETALHGEARAGCTDNARLLIKKGATFDTKNEDGQTPLDVANECNRTETAKFLEGCEKGKKLVRWA